MVWAAAADERERASSGASPFQTLFVLRASWRQKASTDARMVKTKTRQEPSQDTRMVQVNAEQDTVSAARELCRAGGALVAAARDEGTAAELAAMFAALQAAAAGRLARLQGEARLRARFEKQRLWCKWTPGGACMLTWGLQTLPEDLWARSGMCPAESAVMLAATSKRVRGLLGRMQRRLPAAVRVRRRASIESVASGLPRLLAWCSVVSLDVSEHRMGAKGVRILAGALGQCSSLTTLNLGSNDIGDEGAGRLAEVLGQCSSLASLDLESNDIRDEGARSLAGVLGQCSSLAELNLMTNRIGDDVIAMIRTRIQDSTKLLASDQFPEADDDESDLDDDESDLDDDESDS